MSNLKGRVAFVTGAASGIGKQVALRLAAEGAIPVIADLNLDAAAATAKEIQGKGCDAFAVAMNVTDEAQVEKGVADTVAKYGKVDILVSNAGIQIVKPLVDFPFADWKMLLSIHLDGAFLTTRACLKHMYAANYGRVVYMGSVHSKEASKLKAPYVTAKHGLIGLAKPAFMIKIIPHVDCTPRICELVRYYCEDVKLKGAWSGPAALQLFDHAQCDVARLPVREVVSASHFVTDLTLGLGEVVFDYLAK